MKKAFLAWALDAGEWSASRSFPLYSEKTARGTHWIGWVSPTAGLDDMEKRKFLFLPGFEPRQSGPYSVIKATELSRLL
jgi:hypothetical protein